MSHRPPPTPPHGVSAAPGGTWSGSFLLKRVSIQMERSTERAALAVRGGPAGFRVSARCGRPGARGCGTFSGTPAGPPGCVDGGSGPSRPCRPLGWRLAQVSRPRRAARGLRPRPLATAEGRGVETRMCPSCRGNVPGRAPPRSALQGLRVTPAGTGPGPAPARKASTPGSRVCDKCVYSR
ncbi:translation initiation factor IF-2-like [Cebus imitator]|uniref:translation initiation factor IF-2-like n=1 Tax=Cebus imitator TaxID=2715852 RepID=UPI001898198B|nr:translation initiation factor IF-2-like [Cebus imitator]